MDREAFERVSSLVRLFREHCLKELEVADGAFRLHLRRASKAGNPGGAKAKKKAPPQPRKPETKRETKGRTVAVRSPLIGVFYRSPAPENPPFVEIGDLVSEGQTVCIVEAMKVFNEIKAEWSGRVLAIPAENGALVQAGEPLIVIEFLDDQERGET